ncbi:MAG: hypothetical protein GF421_01700 [Candidatus Aminicenantes bacterium]|nr:hypothetical protein [Candidatus Aminicenantes bacterium]
MTLKEIVHILQAELVCGKSHINDEIEFAGGSDLMSDVLAFAKPGILLLTGLSNLQSVRTADIIGAKGIVYVRGKKPDPEGIKLAKKKDIPILLTDYMMYTACGLLYSQHLPGVYPVTDKKS